MARYFYDNTQVQPIARLQYSGFTSTVGWYLADHLGSVTGLMNDAGSLLASRTYDAFGNILSQTGTTTWDRFGFTGEPLDSVTGFQLNAAAGVGRWYNAATMQWTTRDPLEFGGGQSNLYEYAGNNPTNNTDPSGKTTFGLSTLIGTVAGAAIGFVAGGATGEGATWWDPRTWDYSRAWAGAGSGAVPIKNSILIEIRPDSWIHPSVVVRRREFGAPSHQHNRSLRESPPQQPPRHQAVEDQHLPRLPEPCHPGRASA